jgi:hypothetical protein
MNGLIVLICMTAGSLIFAGFMWLLKVREARSFLNVVMDKIKIKQKVSGQS